MPYRKNARGRGRGLTKKQRVEVKKLVTAPIEKKDLGFYLQDSAVSSTHNIVDLMSVVNQGTTEDDRIGDEIKITSLYGRGSVRVGDATNVVRMTLIRWKCNSVPTASQIYEDATIGLQGAIYSPFNHKFRESFVVISDRFYHVDTYNTTRPFILKARAQPKTVFNGTLSTGSNKLYLILSSDSLVTAHPTVTFRGDINFIDA